jgi:exoribonuclease R
VTAPLRRLVDRFGTEVCLALAAGRAPAPELRAALPELPALMAASDRRTREVERAVVDATEAWLLRGREGGTFSAVVVDAEDGKGTVVLDDLAIRGRCTGEGLRPGTRVRVRLDQADVGARSVRFSLAGAA